MTVFLIVVLVFLSLGFLMNIFFMFATDGEGGAVGFLNLVPYALGIIGTAMAIGAV